MSYRWPVLDHYGVNSIDELVEKCTQSLYGLSTEAVLKKQQVNRICVRPLLIAACIGKDVDNKTILLIDSETIDNEIISLPSLVHEIGHTFNLDLPFVHLAKNYHRESERFAESFAYFWLSKTERREELAEFVKKLPRPTGEYLVI